MNILFGQRLFETHSTCAMPSPTSAGLSILSRDIYSSFNPNIGYISTNFECKDWFSFVNLRFLFFIENHQVDVVCIKVNTGKIFHYTSTETFSIHRNFQTFVFMSSKFILFVFKKKCATIRALKNID